MKRGEIAPIFRYLFVIIGGSLILFFFIRFAFNLSDTSNELTSIRVVNGIEDTLTALGVSEDSSTSIPSTPFPKEIIFKNGVNENCGRFQVDNSPMRETKKIIFSPLSLKGKNFNAWTETFYYPYKIENFFYLLDDKSKIYLLYNDNDANSKELADSLDSNRNQGEAREHIPERFKISSIPKSKAQEALQNKNTFDFFKMVYFNTDPIDDGNYLRVNAEDCEAGKDDEICRGTLIFKDGNEIFITKQMLYGAVFAENIENYRCQSGRIMNRFNLVTKHYIRKAELLKQKNPECTNEDINYDTIIANMGFLMSSVNEEEFNEIMNAVNENNKDLSGSRRCTVVF